MEILIVEDDPVMRQLLAALVQRLGFDTREAGDGQAAVEACRAQAPAAVLMDVQMRGMDGLTATRELRRLQRERVLPHFPIVVTSAFYGPADRAACFMAGTDGFVTKPVMMAKLGAELHRVLVREAHGRPQVVQPARYALDEI